MDTPTFKACPVCLSEDREKIERDLVSQRKSVRRVAREYRFPATTMRRHFQTHLPATVVSAAEVAETSRAGDLIEDVEGIAAQQQRLLDKAETGKDYRAAIAAGRELLRCVEMQARLRGDISNSPTINIIASPDFPKVVALVMEFVDPFRRPELAARLAAMQPRMIEGEAGSVVDV